MATEKNITMKQFNGTDYDTLYPKTIASQVDGVYEKDKVLSDGTKSLFGLGVDAVPDDVFSLLKTLVTNAQNTANNAQNSADVKAKIATGSYTGTDETSKTFSFGFTAQILIIKKIPKSTTDSTSYVQQCFLIKGAFCNIVWSIQYGTTGGSITPSKDITFDGNTVTGPKPGNVNFFNTTGANYEYIAIG